jgi:hypothetical protein
VRASVHDKVLAARDYLDVAPTVVRVALDVPVPDHDDRLPTAPTDPVALATLADRWGLTTSVARLTAALRTAGS